MTVIASDGRSMAGDGRVTCDKSLLITDTFRKVRRLSDGRVFGGSGDVASIVNVMGWLESGAPAGGDRPELDKDSFEGMLLDHSGQLLIFDHSCVMVPYDPPYAIGIGGEVALAFMRHGYSPEEAVRAAIKNRVTCGGTIVSLKPQRKRK